MHSLGETMESFIGASAALQGLCAPTLTCSWRLMQLKENADASEGRGVGHMRGGDCTMSAGSIELFAYLGRLSASLCGRAVAVNIPKPGAARKAVDGNREFV